MKKGFTLIELLIVIVVVGVLVTIALPKYQASLERGRSMEAISNLKAASDLINTHYVMNDNNYVRTDLVNSNGYFLTDGFIKGKFFSNPVWAVPEAGSTTQQISVTRVGGDYVLTAINQNGELRFITCTGSEASDRCPEIGMELDPIDETYKMDLRN